LRKKTSLSKGRGQISFLTKKKQRVAGNMDIRKKGVSSTYGTATCHRLTRALLRAVGKALPNMRKKGGESIDTTGRAGLRANINQVDEVESALCTGFWDAGLKSARERCPNRSAIWGENP